MRGRLRGKKDLNGRKTEMTEGLEGEEDLKERKIRIRERFEWEEDWMYPKVERKPETDPSAKSETKSPICRNDALLFSHIFNGIQWLRVE